MILWALAIPLLMAAGPVVVYGDDPPLLDVEALRRQITDEAPGELVNLSLNDTSVSLRIAGRWKASLEAGIGFALTPLGAAAITSDTPFFTQEGDLTLSLWIKEKWFVESSFMDDSALNTYRAGYQGKEGDAIRYLGIGNTGLDYPSFPYLDLGGDSPSSFGAYGHFRAGNMAFHSLIRYDAAAREERVFVGDRERSYSFADLSRPQRGVSFVLPDEKLSAVPELYIQDNKGSLLGSDGMRWRLAEPSEYGASAWLGLVELTLGTYTGGAAEPEGKIAVYYPGDYKLSMGSYYGGSSNDFLRKVQVYFDDTAVPAPPPLYPQSIRLWDYPQPGQRDPGRIGTTANTPDTVTINGIEALVIYEPGTFSPFERQNRYLAPANSSSQAALVKVSTGEAVKGFKISPYEDSYIDAAIQDPGQRRAMRGIYELLQEGPSSRRSPEESWPLGLLYPDLYLPGRRAFNEDLGLRFTSYSSSGAYYIGSDVVPGSVQVFRNGIQDPNFSYSQSGGIVSLANPAGFNEMIRVSYLKQSSERRLGSLAAGIGAVWDPGRHFSGMLGLGLRWNINSESYSENGASSPGSAGLGMEAKWKYDHVRAGLSMGLGLEQPDTTGLYRVAGMEGNEIVLPLPSSSSFLSEIPPDISPSPLSSPLDEYPLALREDLIYRNYRETSFIGGTSLTDVSGSASIVSGESGPYPAMDKFFSSQVLVAEFDLPSGDAWTGFETPLGLNGAFLEQAGRIEIPYRFMNFSSHPASDFWLILQIGSLTDEGMGSPAESTENPNLVLQKILFPPVSPDEPGGYNPSSFSDNEARLAVFTLSDIDRQKLQGAKYMRLLAVKSTAGEISGRVVLAPPIVRGTLWRPISVLGDELEPARGLSFQSINVHEGFDSSLENKYPGMLRRLHSEDSRQRVLELGWDSSLSSGDFSTDGTGPGADGRIPQAPLLNYRSLGFFVRRPIAGDVNDINYPARKNALDEASFRFIIARGPSSLRRPEEIALDIRIPLVDFENCLVAPGEWTRVDVRNIASNPELYINDRRASLSTAVFRPGASGIPDTASGYAVGDQKSGYAAFFLVPGASNLPGGNMAVDEIFLEDTIPSYRMSNGASLDYSRPGAIVSIGKQALISDISFQAAVETGAQGNPFEENPNGRFGMNGRSRAGISLLGAKLTGNYSYSMNSARNEDSYYNWSAGHSLFRSFGPFSVRESFDDAPGDQTMHHRLALNLDTRVRGNIFSDVMRDYDSLQRRWQAGTGGKPARNGPVDFSIDASMGIIENQELDGLSGYARDWIESFASMLPDSGSGADSRNLRLNSRFRLATQPFGTELYFQGLSAFSKPRNASQSSSLLRLDFPIYPAGKNDLRFLFRAEREYRKDIWKPSRDFGEDGKIWAGSFGDSVPLMFSIPLYSLFDRRTGNNMDSFGDVGTANDESYPDLVQFADRYEFSMIKPAGYGASSLFIPRRFALRLGRILERKLDTPRDAINLGAAASFSSVNMFGAMGAIPLFSFYQGDEISHSIETSFIFPKDEKTAWAVRAGQSLMFYGFSGAELNLDNVLSINSSSRIGEGSRWSDSFSASWLIPAEKTLLGSVYGYFARMARTQDSWLTLANLANSEYELLRKETLELVLEKVPDLSNGDYMRFSVAAGHESIVRIFGRLNLSVFGKLTVSEDLSTKILSFLATIGTSLHLMF